MTDQGTHDFEQALDDLVAQVYAGADESPDVRHIEPLLLRLTLLIASEPQHRALAVATLLRLLEPVGRELVLERPGAVEILEFSMHFLRWQEVRVAMSDLAAASSDGRVSSAAHRVLGAFEDPWELGDIYATFDRG